MTTDEADLLRAVLLYPHEDTPRLIYADWLDEHAGDVACGAVGPHHGDRCDGGRVQSPNAQFTQDCPTCGGSGRVSDGRRERAELLRLPGRYEIYPPLEYLKGDRWRLYWCVPGREAALLSDRESSAGACKDPECKSGGRLQVFIFGDWICYPCAARIATKHCKMQNETAVESV